MTPTSPDAWTCGTCRSENPAGTRFCGQCGAGATPSALEPSPTERVGADVGDALRTFVSDRLAERLFEPSVPAGEHRLVTALFADLSGFTPLAGRLDPEALLEVIDPVITALSNVVDRYGGYVEKFAGDALLAIFGAPVSHEDDPARALLVALEMQRELARIRPDLPAEAHDLTLHVGVNTGHGIARLVGSEARVDYAVLGDAVILAQRLESAAPSGEIYVGESTHRLTQDGFEFEPLGELTLKGKVEPVAAWRLVGEGRRLERAGASRLVGREGELARVAAVLEAVSAGHGVLLTVTGEPGVGKSRLAQEAQARAQTRGLRWLEARCLSYGAGLAYWPYSTLLRRFAGIRSDSRAEEASPRLAAALEGSGAGDALPFFARLLGLPAAEVAAMEPEAYRRGLHEAFSSWLRALAQDRPVVVALDDLHWADASSVALTADLARLCRDQRVVLFVTAREEAAPSLAEIAAGITDGVWEDLNLRPLDKADVGALVESLLAARAPPGLVTLVGERAGGNPFFVEELVRWLRETGVVARENGAWRMRSGWESETLPPTIEGVLSARIDRLSHRAAALLQTAAVIGRRSRISLLRAVEEDPLEFEQTLARLVEKGFLDPAEEEGERAVAFHHALVQDAAYSRLLRRRRRELHRRVAEVAESRYGSGDDVIELLARHLYLGEAGPKAVDYLVRAGERAKRLFANEEAIGHFTRARERLEAVPAEGSEPGWWQRQARRVHEGLGDVLFLTGRREEARSAYRAALAQVPEHEPVNVSRLHREIGDTFQSEHRYEEAAQAYRSAEAAVGPAPEDPADAEWWREWLEIQLAMGSLHYWRNETSLMAEAAERARPAVEMYGTPAQRSDFFSTLYNADIRRTRFVVSREALAFAEAAFSASEASGDLWQVAGTRFQLGFGHLWAANLDEAEAHLRAALSMAERIGTRMLRCQCLAYLSTVYRRRGNVVQAKRYASRGLEAATELERPDYVGMTKANLAWVSWRERQLGEATTNGQAALEAWRQAAIAAYPFKWTALWPLLAAALADGKIAEAMEHARALVEAAQQPPPDPVAAALNEAISVAENGHGEAARAELERAIALAQEAALL